jgi:alpha-galactosidase
MQWDLVRHDMMHHFGYYITESSEHTSEYTPWYIKDKYPEFIEKFNIPLDEYPRRCVKQIADWNDMREKLVHEDIEHIKSHEFAAGIINAVVNNIPYKMHGNVLNKGLITNLPNDCCVEVACLVDREGIHPTYVGDLPEQCAAINRTNINVQNLTILAARERKKELVYMAAYLDPHTASELSMDDIKALCDDLFEAHKDWLPEYR